MPSTGTVAAQDMPRRRTLRTTLYDLYFRAEKIITPHLRSSQYAYYDALRAQLSPSKRWLDMGCGHQVFAEWMTREQEEVIARSQMVAGIDLDWQGLTNHAGIDRRVFGDLGRLPFASESWDVISANMVMEHLENPDAVLREVHRVLTPGGAFVFHTPNFYHWGTLVARALPDGLKRKLVRLFEGRVEADVFETHYRLNTAAEVRRRARAAGFDVLEVRHVNSSATLKMLGPVVLLELLYIRVIEHPWFAQLRSGLVVTLRKRPNEARG
jgi:2-polyprenyl-3-methyl-5-hydroxy-6-metoxy-1,4-benzoquinol methylase